jgi:hypothetical protein
MAFAEKETRRLGSVERRRESTALKKCRALPTGASENFQSAEKLVLPRVPASPGLSEDDCTPPLLEAARKLFGAPIGLTKGQKDLHP